MSQLLSDLMAQIKSAMIAKESSKLEILRTLHSDIKNVSINNKIDITDEIVLDAVQKTIKQKRDSIEQFAKGGRQDLVDKESAAIELITVFLPAQLSAEELTALVAATAKELGLSGPKDMGTLMKAVGPLTKGKAEGKAVSEAVKACLAAL